MLPGGVLSTAPVRAKLLYPGERHRDPGIEYTLAGPAIGVPIVAQRATLWTFGLAGGQVSATPDGGAPVVLQATPNADYFGADFDNSMHYTVAWTDGTGKITLVYYDGTLPGYTTIQFTGSRPQVSLDDGRFVEQASSDVIVAYMSGSNLCYRQQRDRFLTEYTLATSTPAAHILARIGMGLNNRMQFLFTIDGTYGS